jgi:hypothetical protein
MQGRNRVGATKGETWEREGKKKRERNQGRQRGELTVWDIERGRERDQLYMYPQVGGYVTCHHFFKYLH